MQDFDESLLRSLFLRFIHPRLSAIAAGNQNSYNFVCGSRPRINLSLAATVDLSLTSQGVKHSSPLARASHEKRRSSSRELRVWYGVTTERARACEVRDNLANRRCRRDAIYEQKVIYPFGITLYLLQHEVLCIYVTRCEPKMYPTYDRREMEAYILGSQRVT